MSSSSPYRPSNRPWNRAWNRSEYPVYEELIPSQVLYSGPYSLHFARTNAELPSIFRLRFNVFNTELNEGLAESAFDQLDRDEFDAQCHHLYIRDNRSGEVVGTYRLQTRKVAQSGNGFYSNSLFNLSQLPDHVLERGVEIGRACIREKHRSIRVLYLLWRGIGCYLAHNDKLFLFGCCSLTSQNPREGAAVYEKLEQNGQLTAGFVVSPQDGFECLSLIDAEDNSTDEIARIPRLMRAYLSFGATICSMPAIDRAFKTIDYLALFDISSLSDSVLAYYQAG